MSIPFTNRRKVLGQAIATAKLDALVITHPANWYYLTGFTGEAGTLIARKSSATLISDGRFTTQAREEAPAVRYVEQKGSLLDTAGKFLREKALKRVGFDPTQVSVAQLRLLAKGSRGAHTMDSRSRIGGSHPNPQRAL